MARYFPESPRQSVSPRIHHCSHDISGPASMAERLICRRHHAARLQTRMSSTPFTPPHNSSPRVAMSALSNYMDLQGPILDGKILDRTGQIMPDDHCSVSGQPHGEIRERAVGRRTILSDLADDKTAQRISTSQRSRRGSKRQGTQTTQPLTLSPQLDMTTTTTTTATLGATAAATATATQDLDRRPQCFEHGCGGRRFSSVDNYRRHMREQSGDKRVRCDFCGTTFTRKSNRDQHVAQLKCEVVKAVVKEASSEMYAAPAPDGHQPHFTNDRTGLFGYP